MTMTIFSNLPLNLPRRYPQDGPLYILRSGYVLILAVTLSGCAVEVENTQAAQALSRQTQDSGSVYAGWRVFQDRCASCHGTTASGTVAAPDLLLKVREMSVRRFVNLVLTRYDWPLPLPQTRGDSAAQTALVDSVVQRREGFLVMPAWQDEPRVNAHVVDLYAYLWARAEGTLGVGRPKE